MVLTFYAIQHNADSDSFYSDCDAQSAMITAGVMYEILPYYKSAIHPSKHEPNKTKPTAFSKYYYSYRSHTRKVCMGNL